MNRLAASAALLVGLVAALMLLASGPGTRLGLWDFRIGFQVLRYGAYLGGAAAALAVVLLLIPATRKGRVAALALALMVGFVCLAVPLQFRARGAGIPPINDINTDLESARFAEEQKKSYPDVAPLELAAPPAAAFTRALDTAQAMGWQIVKSDPKARTIEAVDTTLWFGFKDDITVRVSMAGAGSRIDVRSRSRVGRGDLGTNARRIRAYFERLK